MRYSLKKRSVICQSWLKTIFCISFCLRYDWSRQDQNKLIWLREDWVLVFLANFFLNGHVVMRRERQNRSNNKLHKDTIDLTIAVLLHFKSNFDGHFISILAPAMCCRHRYFARTVCYRFDPFPVRVVDGCYNAHANPIRWAWWAKTSFKCCCRAETNIHQRSIIATTDAAAPILVSMEGYVRRFVTLTAPGLTVPVLTPTLVSRVRRWNTRDAAKT